MPPSPSRRKSRYLPLMSSPTSGPTGKHRPAFEGSMRSRSTRPPGQGYRSPSGHSRQGLSKDTAGWPSALLDREGVAELVHGPHLVDLMAEAGGRAERGAV